MLQAIKVILVVAIVAGALGCNRGPERQDSGAARVVDSFVPREVALRRFQGNLTSVAQLESAFLSRDSLLAAFVRALSARDTAALARMAVSRAEFAYLYYPSTPQGMPPYDLEPGLMWHLMRERSERGIRRALSAYGGQRLQVLGHDCGPGSSKEGRNIVVGPCTVRLRDERGETVSVQLMTQILERDGRYKILNYANSL
jgi:hypothetical protein